MNDNKKRFWLTIAIIAIVQYVPALTIFIAAYIKTGVMPTAIKAGLGAIATGIIYIPLLKIEKLKGHVFPKALKIFSILNFVFGILYIILGITIFG